MKKHAIYPVNHLEHIRDDIRESLKSFTTWYMIDLRPTYVCSLTPSYAAQEICGQAEAKDGASITEEELLELETCAGEWTYLDTCQVDSFLNSHPELIREIEQDEDETYTEAWERTHEYYLCNSSTLYTAQMQLTCTH